MSHSGEEGDNMIKILYIHVVKKFLEKVEGAGRTGGREN